MTLDVQDTEVTDFSLMRALLRAEQSVSRMKKRPRGRFLYCIRKSRVRPLKSSCQH
jgi:hypothetical protein